MILSILPLLMDAMTFAPTPSPKIVRSGAEVYSVPALVTITDWIFPFCTIALYSEEDPEETLTSGGIEKLNTSEEPYPTPGSSTLIAVIAPLTIGDVMA